RQPDTEAGALGDHQRRRLAAGAVEHRQPDRHQRGKRGQQWQVERAYQPEQQVEQPAQDDVHGVGSPASTASPSAAPAPGNGGRATSSNPSGILPSSQASNTARAIGSAALPP